MSENLKKCLKITGIITLALLLIVCTVINIWYLFIFFNGKNKVVSKTFNVGTFQLADGSTKHFVELEYWANSDNKGKECLEVKFNYLMDETKENCYSQGLQYVRNNDVFDMTFSYNNWDLDTDIISESSTGWWLWKEYTYKIQRPYVFIGGKSFNYMSVGNQYLRSTNPINADSSFKIEIGDQLYLVKFKGKYKKSIGSLQNHGTPLNDSTFDNSLNRYGNTYMFYREYDVNYFVKSLLETVKTSKLGSKSECVFEFGNLFDYYAYNTKTKTYDEECSSYDKVVKLSEDIKSYYSILVTTHEEGLTRSSNSMFKSILGNQSLNLTDDYASEDYFIGRTIINVDLTSFDMVCIDDKNVALKLNKEFLSYYAQYSKSIELDITVNIDTISNLGYIFAGFSADSGLNGYSIRSVSLLSNGNKTDYDISNLKGGNV